jgi:hypothetical protein
MLIVNMFSYVAFYFTPIAANITKDFHDFQVSQFMLTQIMLSLKKLATFGTFNGFLVGVNQFVSFQISQSFEFLFADLTFEVSFVTVNYLMSL